MASTWAEEKKVCPESGPQDGTSFNFLLFFFCRVQQLLPTTTEKKTLLSKKKARLKRRKKEEEAFCLWPSEARIFCQWRLRTKTFFSLSTAAAAATTTPGAERVKKWEVPSWLSFFLEFGEKVEGERQAAGGGEKPGKME